MRDPMFRSRHPGGFVVTIEFLILMAVLVVPLILGVVVVGRKVLTVYLDYKDYREAPYQQAIVVDSSVDPKVVGPVVGYDRFEAPLVIFRESKKKGGVVLGVRPTRVTSYAEVFYSEPTCTSTPEIRKANETSSPMISNDNIPAGFLYQDHHLAAAMGSGNKLYVDSLAYASLSAPGAPAGLLASANGVWVRMRETLGVMRRRALEAFGQMSHPVGTWVDLIIDALSPQVMAAVGDYYLYTGQTGAQTQIDRQHTSNWYVTVTGASKQLGGGLFTIKRGPSTTADIVFTVRANGPGGAVLATKTLTAASVTSSYTLTPFDLSDASANTPYAMSAGTYYMTLTSTAVDAQASAYFIKNNPSDTCLLKRPAIIGHGKQCTPAKSTGTVSIQPPTGSFTIAKTATSVVQQGTSFGYTLSLGNDGGGVTGTTATISEQLPSGVTATGISFGFNVTSVTCLEGAVSVFPTSSSAGALLKCTVSLGTGIPPSTVDGASVTLNVSVGNIAPATLTNYVSVDASGATSPPTPGASCTTTNCASAITTIQVAATPASLRIVKTADTYVAASGTITYGFSVSNEGGTDYTDTMSAITVIDQLPAGVYATAVTAGSGVSSISCGMLPSSTGALLTCSVTPSSTLTALLANDMQFAITATAPATAGYYQNYVSVDPDGSGGGASASTPGPSCTSRACASAGTAVDIMFVTAAPVGYVWRSQSVAPPAGADPSPPCYAIYQLPDDLVTATEIIDFDDNTTNYTLPFRVFFRSPEAAPALSGTE